MNRILIWASILFCIVGCNKINDDDASRIIGRWQWVESYSYEFLVDGLPLVVTHIPADHDFILEFRKNGSIRWYVDSELQGKIKASGLSSVKYGVTSQEYQDGIDITVFYSSDKGDDSESSRWYNDVCKNNCCMNETRFPFNSKCEDDISYRNHYIKLD